MQRRRLNTQWEDNRFDSPEAAIDTVLNKTYVSPQSPDFTILGNGDFCVSLALPFVKEVGADRHDLDFSVNVFTSLARYLHRKTELGTAQVNGFFGQYTEPTEFGEKSKLDMATGATPSRPDDFGRMIIATMQDYAQCESAVAPNARNWTSIGEASYEQLRTGITVVSFSDN